VTNDDAPTQRLPADSALTRTGLASGRRYCSRYTLEAQIGRGGMGVVWRAHDEKLDRPVALKFLPPEVAADAEAVRDLKLETRRCLDLTHANIVRVYDFIEDEAGAAIAMEYVEGESLARVKAAAPGGCLAAADLTPFVAQLCAALRYAHQVARVAHHDLKPANVLVTRDGVIKVTDFGIARSLSETQTRLTNKAGTTSGTLLYMSPQQLAGEKPTAADDIYALGAMLYELLTGKPPFFRGDLVSLRQQVLERTPAPLEAHRRDVGCTGAGIPPEWSEAILACLAKKPEDRPATADEVAARLGIALEPMPTAPSSPWFSRPTARATDLGQPVPPPRRSLVPWLIGVGSTLVALAGAWIHFGIYVPERARLAAEQERARTAELALHAERVRQAEEKRREAEEKRQAAEAQAIEDRKKEEEARVRMTAEQEAYSAILTRIAALTDNAPVVQFTATQRTVRTYLRTAPERYRDPVEKAWTERQSAWQTAAAARRPGSLLVETDPPGTAVVLYPRNERKTSPALFDDVKPGEVSLRIEKEGFESKDVPFTVKPGVTNKIGPIRLTATHGTLAITSDPPDIYVLVEGNGKRLEGHTPYTSALLPPGDYQVTFRRANWSPLVKTVTVARGQTTPVSADLKGFDLELISVPAGARITVDTIPVNKPTPVKLLGLPPREYQITATLDGYEILTRKISLTRTTTVNLPLREKPLYRELRRIAGVRWRYDSFGTSAELFFTPQGKITGSHRSGLGGQVRDTGTVDTFNANTGTLVARFNPGQATPFYSGNVQIKLVDDDHLAVSWMVKGSAERLVFERDKAQK
jgi:serine/threonine protein kinase